MNVVWHPVPEVGRIDTSLRYTDILFGFVIRELFLRLQNRPELNAAVQLHLIVGTTLVLGSWIGYRRSLNRSSYEVKFFNLPLARFIVDQCMLVLYFRIAVLTEVDGSNLPAASALATGTTRLVVYVFVLYVAWDLLGIWMAKAQMTVADGTKKQRYPAVKDSHITNDKQPAEWVGFWISAVVLVLLFFLWLIIGCFNSNLVFYILILLLLGYRWAKEIRTSCRSLQPT